MNELKNKRIARNSFHRSFVERLGVEVDPMVSHKPMRPKLEVLPPQRAVDANQTVHGLPRLIAFFMDNLIEVPATKMKFGLNPIMDLIPGIGDAAAALISSATLYVAASLGVPKIVLARMSLNILLNAVMGIIPGVGEVFAFWFRPSQRNYELLQKHLADAKRGESTTHLAVCHWFNCRSPNRFCRLRICGCLPFHYLNPRAIWKR